MHPIYRKERKRGANLTRLDSGNATFLTWLDFSSGLARKARINIGLDKFLTYDILLLSVKARCAYNTIDNLNLGERGGGEAK